MIGFWSITIWIYIQYFHCLGYVLLQGYFYLIVGRSETKVVFSRKWVVIFFLALNWIVRMIHLKFHRGFQWQFYSTVWIYYNKLLHFILIFPNWSNMQILFYQLVGEDFAWRHQSECYLFTLWASDGANSFREVSQISKFCSPSLYFANIIYPISSSIDDSYK